MEFVVWVLKFYSNFYKTKIERAIKLYDKQ